MSHAHKEGRNFNEISTNFQGNKRFLIPWNYSFTSASMIKYIKGTTLKHPQSLTPLGAYPLLTPVKFSEISDPALTAELTKYEKQEIWTKYKFGLLYVKEGQTNEDEIFGNSKSDLRSPRFIYK
jgi:hypothetical protein